MASVQNLENREGSKKQSLFDLKDVGAHPEFDDLAANLKKLDKDGDGHIDTFELVDFLQGYAVGVRKKKQLLRLGIALLAAAVVLSTVNFGLTIAAIILAREVHTSGGILVDEDDNLVYTSLAYESSSFTWGTSVNHWIGVESFAITSDDGSLRKYVVSAVNASAPANVAQVVTAGGQVLRVDLAAQTLTDAESGAVLVSEAARRRRRLEEQRELCTGTCADGSGGNDCGTCAVVDGQCDCGI